MDEREILRQEAERAWREADFIAKERAALVRALTQRENDLALLRDAVDAMMAPLGYHGTISARDDRVQAVMDALAHTDKALPRQAPNVELSVTQRLKAAAVDSNETTGGSTAVLSTAESERRRLKGALISLAAQMATRRSMPAPDDWPGWGLRVPQKLWRAARRECDKASDQCGHWAYELRMIADAL